MTRIESDYASNAKYRGKKLDILRYRLGHPYRATVAHRARVKAFRERAMKKLAKGYFKYLDRRATAWWFWWSDVDLSGKWAFKIRRQLL